MPRSGYRRAFTLTGFGVQLHRIGCSTSRIPCSASAGFGVQDPPDYAVYESSPRYERLSCFPPPPDGSSPPPPSPGTPAARRACHSWAEMQRSFVSAFWQPRRAPTTTGSNHPASVGPQNANADNRNKTHAASQLILSRNLHAVAPTPPRVRVRNAFDADPDRGNHRLDPNPTCSVALISRPLHLKLLTDSHLTRDDPQVWVTTRTKDPHLSDPATYYFF